MKKTILLSSVALMFSACVNKYNIPEIPQPTNNQSFSEYLNNYEYPSSCFGHGPHAYCTKKPIRTIYSKGNEVLLQYDNLILNDQSLNLYHHAYRYCQGIGGKSVIKKEVFSSMLRHKPALFNADNPQVDEFVKIKDNYSPYEISDGYFECKAGDKSFEITHKFGEYAFVDDSDRFIGEYKSEVTALFVIKFQTPQNAPYINTDDYYRYVDERDDKITWVKKDAGIDRSTNDKRFYYRILPLYHICKARYNGIPYIVGDTTENKVMLLGDYLLESVKYDKGISEFGDYTISCVSNAKPFTFKKTFNGELERYVNETKVKYQTYYSMPAAYYEVVSRAEDLSQYEKIPFEQRAYINKLIHEAYPKNYALTSSLYHNISAYILRTPNHSNGYIGIKYFSKVNNEFNALHTYKIEDNQKRYIGFVGAKDIEKAKEVVEKKSDNIIKNCSLNLDNFKIANYTVYCQNNVIYIKNGDKIHYVKKI